MIGDSFYRVKYHQKKNQYKDMTKEERAKELHNVVCHRCKYQNHAKWIRMYGTCHLCGATLDKRYFIKTLMRRLENEK